jgi:hypothetical protein
MFFNGLLDKIDTKNPIHMYVFLALIIWMVYILNSNYATLE